MRFMVIVKATPESESGVLPDQKILAEMGKYNEELVKAGVMLAGEGLQASSKGVRVKFSGDKRIVTDGPVAEVGQAPVAPIFVSKTPMKMGPRCLTPVAIWIVVFQGTIRLFRPADS